MTGGRIDREQMNARAAEQLQRLGLDISPDRMVRTLRVAAQQQVEIAKALTLDAKLLMFDEPTAALGAEETERLFRGSASCGREGVSFIYVSHRLDEIARDRRPRRGAARRPLVARHDRADVPVRSWSRNGRPQRRAAVPAAARARRRRSCSRSRTCPRPSGFRDVRFSVRGGRDPRHRRDGRRRPHRARARDRRRGSGLVRHRPRRRHSRCGSAARARRSGRRGAGAGGPQGAGHRARPADRRQHRRRQPRPARRGRLGQAERGADIRRVRDRQAAASRAARSSPCGSCRAATSRRS